MLGHKLSYSIYLLKQDFVDNNKHLQHADDCTHRSIPISGQANAELYVKTKRSKVHSWSTLLPTSISGIDWSKYRSSTFYGLLLVPVQDRVFALTSGFGRYLLDPFAIENRFGFKTVLNSVDPLTIQQLSKSTLSENPKRSIEQVTKGVNIDQFGIDTFTDLIQRVKGRSKAEGLGLSLDGEDALKISVEHELNEIPNLLQECLQFYLSDEYKKHFTGIDNLAPIKDKNQKALLNKVLEQKLNYELDLFVSNDPPSGEIWAAIPEIVLDEEIDHYTYKDSDSAPLYYDIELKDLFREKYWSRHTKNKKKVASLQSLSRDSIYVIRADQTRYPRWNALSCINASVEYGGEKYFFLDGDWFLASKNYLDLLDTKISSIPSSGLVFTEWPQNVREEHYLKSNPLQSHDKYIVLDRNNILLEGQTPVEPCDIYTSDQRMVHIKRYGTSAVLGHLFNQGFVSGHLLLNSIEFKDKFNEKLTSDLLITDIKPSEFTIAYVIGTKHPTKLQLPLFSKIALAKSYDELRKKGFNVTLDLVHVVLQH